jgi:ferredoxin
VREVQILLAAPPRAGRPAECVMCAVARETVAAAIQRSQLLSRELRSRLRYTEFGCCRSCSCRSCETELLAAVDPVPVAAAILWILAVFG